MRDIQAEPERRHPVAWHGNHPKRSPPEEIALRRRSHHRDEGQLADGHIAEGDLDALARVSKSNALRHGAERQRGDRDEGDG